MADTTETKPLPVTMTEEKQQFSVWRDLFEPGWREREAERAAKFLAAVPMRQPRSCEWTNCPTRVGDVCCNDRDARQPGA